MRLLAFTAVESDFIAGSELAMVVRILVVSSLAGGGGAAFKVHRPRPAHLRPLRLRRRQVRPRAGVDPLALRRELYRGTWKRESVERTSVRA